LSIWYQSTLDFFSIVLPLIIYVLLFFFAFNHLIFFTMPAIPVPVQTSGNPSDGVSSMDTPPSNFTPSAVEFSVEFSSPFYLHHGDTPRTLLVSQPLIGINYHTWKRSMTMAHSAKNKLCFIDG
jgi:hypothetical protein